MFPPDQSKQPKVGVGVMIIRMGKILLGKRKTGYGFSTYGWIGGHLDFGETLEDCARRETMEETGLSVQQLKLISIIDMVSQDNHYVDIEFLAEGVTGEPKVLEPEKVESWDWYDMGNLPSPLFQPVKLAIKSYHSGIIYTSPSDNINY